MTYDGKKFYPLKEVEYYDEFGYKRIKTIFCMTKSYKKYLQEKREYENKLDILRLKNKLEYQQKHYGEVDNYDLQEYQRLIQRSYYK